VAASLLTRLARAADPNSSERRTWSDNDLEASVTEHLVNMLNTRQGSCLTCPDYGMIEVSELLHDFPDAIGLVQRAIKNSIQLYEPRLKNVQVRHTKTETAGSMVMEFEITGQLQHPDGRKQALRFGASVDESGNFKMS